MQTVKLWQMPTIKKCDDKKINQLDKQLLGRLCYVSEYYQSVYFASSLAAEDMVLTDMIARNHLPIEIFTLNTLMLHPETLDLLAKINQYYALDIHIFLPNQNEVNLYEKQYGKMAMYESLALRKKCCYIRKIEPLNRALHNADAWMTGQRQQQSVTREDLQFKEIDKSRDMVKFNPLYDWTEENIWHYIQVYQVPTNQLYFKGFPSIGCEPCTKPVKVGEDIRSGRWWWENQDSKECGLHQQ